MSSRRPPKFHHIFAATPASKKITSVLTRLQSKYFRVNYSPNYTTFITHQVLTDPYHPLYFKRKRELEQRPKEGLWWHVTSPIDLSKRSTVRTTCRKRFRKAFESALRERGFDERGNLVEPDALKKHLGTSGGWVGDGKNNAIALTGSLRLIVSSDLIPAKSEVMKEESGRIVNALLEGIKAGMELNPRAPEDKSDVQPQGRSPLERSKTQPVPRQPMQRGPSKPSLPKTSPKTQTAPRKAPSPKPATRPIQRGPSKLSLPKTSRADRSQSKSVHPDP